MLRHCLPTLLLLIAVLPTAASAQAASDSMAPQRPATAREFWVDLSARPVTGRGSTARLLFYIINYEDTTERIRLTLETSAGWRVLDSALLEREHTLESGEELEGELQVVVPADARVGSTHRVRLIVEIEGDPGVAESSVPIRVDASGGLAPNRAGLTGVGQIYRHGIDVGAQHGGTTAGSLELSGSIAPGLNVSGNFHRGHRLNLPPILSSYAAAGDRYSAEVRRGDLSLLAGNMVNAQGNAVTGPFTRIRGVTLRRSNGPVMGDVSWGRPVGFDGTARGGLVRGTVSLQTPRFRIAVLGSDLSRPTAGFSPGVRATGAGIEAAWSNSVHRLQGRAGYLALRGDTAGAVSGVPLEVNYALSTHMLNTSVRYRQMPPSLPGVYNPPAELSGDIAVRLKGALRVNARGYRTQAEVLAPFGSWSSEGLSGGLQLLPGGGYRLDIRANYRETVSARTTTQRTVQASGSLPAGPLMLDAFMDLGRQLSGGVQTPTRVLRGGARWNSMGNSVFGTLMYSDYGRGLPRLRADVFATLRMPYVDLDGGMWASRGPSYGGTPGVWGNLAISLTHGFSVSAGGEFVRGRIPYTRYVDPITGEPLSPEAADDPTRGPLIGIPVQVPSSPWRGTLGLRRGLAIPLPWKLYSH
jgi:hypothetical protein